MNLENQAEIINNLLDAKSRVEMWEYKLKLIDSGINFHAKLDIDFTGQRRSSCFCYLDFDTARTLVLQQIENYKGIRDVLQKKYNTIKC